MSDLESRLNDADAQKVLARALELQAQHAGSLTVAQVRGIASEMAIPESAVEQALSEHRAATMAASLPSTIDRSEGADAKDRSGPSRRFVNTLALVGSLFVILLVVLFFARLFP